MKKKPGLLFAVCVLALIILAAVFKLHLTPVSESPVMHLKDPATHIFVCPMANETWDSVSQMFTMGKRFVSMGIVFIVVILLFSWGWALYQNLLKDKFVADAYKDSWGLTKIVFWFSVVLVILTMTPNYFRPKISGRSNGKEINWVLCDQQAEHARALPLSKIKKMASQ